MLWRLRCRSGVGYRKLRFINHYHDSPGYIAALAASVSEYWDHNGPR